MRKKLLLFFGFAITTIVVYNISTQKPSIEKQREQHAEFLKNHPFNERLKLTKKERKSKGITPNKYFEQEYLLEMNPVTGKTHPERVFRVQQELKAQRKLQRVPGDAADNKWVERGPNNVGGRTRVVMFDPNDATHKRVFAGGVSGGLWVNNDITDVNSAWTRVGIDENLSISCMTVDPNNSQIMYLGTGESYTGDDAVGNGVWKSTDGGTSWASVFRDDFNSDRDLRLYYINDIIAWNNPSTNKTEVFVGVAGAYYSVGDQFSGVKKHGLYKSTDDGTSWSWLSPSLPAIPGTTANTYGALYEPNDFEIGADNTLWMGTESNIYGNGGGTILKSTDGTTFSVAHTYTNARRTEIATSKTNKDKVYALYYVSDTPKIEVTTDGFSSTTNIITPKDADNGIPNTDFTRGQSFYDLVIEVDPTDDAKIYVGGIDLFRSTNSGGSWKQISKWSNNNNLAAMTIPTVHADQHSWAFHPTDVNKAIIGNDGGVFYANSLSAAETTTTAIAVRNKEYNVTQFYTVGVAPITTFNNQDYFLAGAQDNGTPYFENANANINSSEDISGGDGAYSFFDQDGTDQYLITNYVYNQGIRLYDYNTSAWRTINSENTRNGDFINPEELDSSLDILYSNYSSGSNYIIRRYTNIKPGGSAVSAKNLTNALMTAAPSAFKISPFTTNKSNLFVGLKNGELLKIAGANSFINTWTKITGPDFSGSVSAIELGASESEIFVTMHNYGVQSIWYTADGGTTWSAKEGNLPDIPVKAILQNPLNTKEVIIGTELGIWKTNDFTVASPIWEQSNNGMSNVKVTDLDLRDDNTVFVSTYGRGVFSGKFTAAVASVDEVVKGSKVFTMYPTVSNGEFTIFAKNTLGKANLMLFDINGKQVFSKQVDFTRQEKQPISVNLTSGVYIVNLIDANNRKSTGKVIIK